MCLLIVYYVIQHNQHQRLHHNQHSHQHNHRRNRNGLDTVIIATTVILTEILTGLKLRMYTPLEYGGSYDNRNNLKRGTPW